MIVEFFTKSSVTRLLFGTLCIVLLASSSASASILGSGLTFNSEKDKLTDDSVGIVKDVDGSNTLTSGDIIQGLIHIQTVERDVDAGGAPLDSEPVSSVFALYSFEVASSYTGVSGQTVLRLTEASGGDSISGLLALTGFTSQEAALTSYSGLATDATFAVFEKAGDWTTADLVAGGGGASVINGGALGGLIDGNSWTLDMTAGLVRTSNFYEIQLENLGPLTGALPVPQPDDSTQIAEYRAALDVVAHAFGGSTLFLDLFTRDFSVGPFDPANRTGHITTAGRNNINTPVDPANTNGWEYQDAGDFFVNAAVPEPASMLVWAGLLGVGGLVAARRRKAAKA